MAKGGAHGKGQKMPYRVVCRFPGEKPRIAAHWTADAALHDMLRTVQAANAGRVSLDGAELRAVDVQSGEVIGKPLRCTVCGEQWATEYGPGRIGGPSTCRGCEGKDTAAMAPKVRPIAGPEPRNLSGPDDLRPLNADPGALRKALDQRNLEHAVRPDGRVDARANGILWTMQAVPHAQHGGFCGVWSVTGPQGCRGYFTAENAAHFIARRTTP